MSIITGKNCFLLLLQAIENFSSYIEEIRTLLEFLFFPLYYISKMTEQIYFFGSCRRVINNRTN